jgi:HsdM N-terminal domain/Type I restriction modification DNA specificity domain
MATSGKALDVSTLESWLWEAASQIRGPLDAPKFKDYILPLVFLKRLSDVFEDEIAHLGHEFGDPKKAARLVDENIRNVGHGAHQKNLSAALVKSISIPIPPLPEQLGIAQALQPVDRKQALDALFTTLLHDLMTARVRVQHLAEVGRATG